MSPLMSILKKRASIIVFTAFIFCGLILVSGKVEAATLVSQTVSDSAQIHSVGGPYFQQLGTGLSGNVYHVQISGIVPSSGIDTWGVSIQECASSSYASCTTYTNDNGLTWTPTGYPLDVPVFIDFPFTTNHFTFNPSYYYQIVVYSPAHFNSGGSTIEANIFGSVADTYPNGICTFYPTPCSTLSSSAAPSDLYFQIADAGGFTSPTTTFCNGGVTQICHFTPLDTATTTGPTVTFNLQDYIAEADLGTYSGIKIVLHNIDQNVLLLGALSPSDISLYDGEATSSGEFNFSTTTVIGDGNYRIETCLVRSYIGGFLTNPFSNTIVGAPDCQSHQFIVGQSTFIGDLSQNGYSIFHDLVNGTTTATTTASASSCSFWYPTTFNIFKCGGFLFVPDAHYLNTSLASFKDGVLTRVPWGYLSRTIVIFSSTSTQSLPTYTASFMTGTNGNLSTSTLTFDPGDMLAGAGTLLTDTRDPFTGKNTRDVFEPFVQLAVAIAVLFTIVADLTGSHRHSTEPHEQNVKRT